MMHNKGLSGKPRLKAFHHLSKLGSEPGTLQVHADLAEHEVQMTVNAFDKTSLFSNKISDLAELDPLLKKYPVIWLNICGLGDIDLLHCVSDKFHLNILAMEDVVNVHQRPKVEEYDEVFFAVTSMPEVQNQGLLMQQISMFWGKNFVVTFQEHCSDCFQPLLERIAHGGNRERLMRPEYLSYAILDTLIDGYFPILDLYGENLDTIEEEAIDNVSTAVIRTIHDFKHDLHILRRAMWSQREAMGTFRELATTYNQEMRFFIRDCEDHTIQLIDIMESYRERTSGLMDIYLSSVSNRTNRIVKVLTIIATIFMPIGVLAGIYGMNYDRSSPWNMPELSWRFGYEYFWCLVLTVVSTLLFSFWRNGWFKR